jgi:outer membrane protein, multidrug efflux system
MVGPNYHKPSVPVPRPLRSRPHPLPPLSARAIGGRVFHDLLLDSLETQTAAIRDIKIAVAHVDGASAATMSAHSYLLPTVSAEPSVSRNCEAQNRPNNGSTQGKAAIYNDIQLPLVAKYEIDAWGRIRRSIQSARATQEATEADLRFVRLSVEASVAVDYYELRKSDQELGILHATVADLTRGLTLTRSRYRHGLIGALAVKQAQTILDQTAAQKQALEIQRAQLEHAIAALLGRTIEGSSHEQFVTAVYLYLDAVNLVGRYSAAGPISCCGILT